MASKISTFVILCLFVAFSSVFAQPAIQWQKAYGGSGQEWPEDMKQTTDGGYIFIGSTSSADGDITRNQGSDDIWVVKLTATGAISWQKTYGGALGDEGRSIEQTTDGGYILLGTTNSTDGDITSNHGGADIWVVKLDTNGSIIWQKTYGGSLDEQGSHIEQTRGGGYILLGGTNSTDGDITSNHGEADIWVIKLDTNGSIIWQKTYGGSNEDEGYYVEQTSDGGYIVAGYTESSDGDVTKAYGKGDEWVLKLTDVGAITWQKTYGGSGHDVSHVVHQTSDGGYISIGDTESDDRDVTGHHGNAGDMWVVKMNPAGSIQWAKALGGTLDDEGISIIETGEGGYYALGLANSIDGDVTGLHDTALYVFDMWLVSLDKSGFIQWQKALGGTGNEYGKSILQTKDGGCLAFGATNSTDGDATGCGLHMSPGLDPDDIWVVKMYPYLNVNGITTNSEEIRVYPTPTNGLINISLPSGYEAAAIKLMNALGQGMPFETVNGGSNRSIMLSGIPAGLYLLEVVGKDAVTTYKIVYQP